MPTPLIKHHFNVSNSYVIRKIRLLLFPWLHRPWVRRQRGVGVGVGGSGVGPVQGQGLGQGEFMPPREDLNSPDLYIPGAFFVCFEIWKEGRS